MYLVFGVADTIRVIDIHKTVIISHVGQVSSVKSESPYEKNLQNTFIVI